MLRHEREALEALAAKLEARAERHGHRVAQTRNEASRARLFGRALSTDRAARELRDLLATLNA